MIDPARLAAATAQAPAAKTDPPKQRTKKRVESKGIAESAETLAKYLAERGVVVSERKTLAGGGVALILDGCPMNPDHGHGSDTAVIWRPTGLGFECKHSSCATYTWADVRERIDPDRADSAPSGIAGQVTELILLASKVQLFHAHDVAYATAPVDGHWETHPVTNRRFRRWLTREYFDSTGDAPKTEALGALIDLLEARALFEGPELTVAVRLAEHDGAYWLDLCDPEWRVVRIDAKGWTVVTESPVRFMRRPGMEALPEPVRGGSLNELRALVNVPDDSDWALVIAWLVAAMRPHGPYPLLAVNGEQGSAKSTLCRMLRRLIDPNKSDIRAAPRDQRDLAIAASNSWIVAYDNISNIQPWLSDCLCRLSTGAGFSTRKLWTDDDEQIFEAERPVLLNGIEDFVEKADLLDRTVGIQLPSIPDDQRQDEETLWAAFEQARSRILGALLDAVVCGMRNLPDIHPERMPRMADFVKWAVACESALGLKPGTFLKAYEGDRSAANEMALAASTLANALMKLIDSRDEPWDGTTASLLMALDETVDEQVRKHRDWPKTPKQLGGDLRRLAPNLRKAGYVVIEPPKTGGNRRKWRLAKAAAQSAERAQRAETPPEAPETPGSQGALLRVDARSGEAGRTNAPPKTRTVWQ